MSARASAAAAMLLLAVASSLWGCGYSHGPGPVFGSVGATHFGGDAGIEIELLDASPGQRVEAARRVFDRLDVLPGIDASQALVDGVVAVTVLRGVNEEPWRMPFHVVWPDPGSVASVRLLNWAAVYRFNEGIARTAREEALMRLRDGIERAVAGTEYADRIRVQSYFR